jgi:hypothetical protein
MQVTFRKASGASADDGLTLGPLEGQDMGRGQVGSGLRATPGICLG